MAALAHAPAGPFEQWPLDLGEVVGLAEVDAGEAAEVEQQDAVLQRHDRASLRVEQLGEHGHAKQC